MKVAACMKLWTAVLFHELPAPRQGETVVVASAYTPICAEQRWPQHSPSTGPNLPSFSRWHFIFTPASAILFDLPFELKRSAARIALGCVSRQFRLRRISATAGIELQSEGLQALRTPNL